MRAGQGREEERASAAIALVVASALALVVFVMLANVVMMQFTRGAVRAAVDEAVRAGSRADDPVAACETRARAVLAGLLGTAGSGRDVTCSVSGSPPSVRARGEVAMVPWLPGFPVWRVEVHSTAVQEVLP